MRSIYTVSKKNQEIFIYIQDLAYFSQKIKELEK